MTGKEKGSLSVATACRPLSRSVQHLPVVSHPHDSHGLFVVVGPQGSKAPRPPEGRGSRAGWCDRGGGEVSRWTRTKLLPGVALLRNGRMELAFVPGWSNKVVYGSTTALPTSTLDSRSILEAFPPCPRSPWRCNSFIRREASQAYQGAVQAVRRRGGDPWGGFFVSHQTCGTAPARAPTTRTRTWLGKNATPYRLCIVFA